MLDLGIACAAVVGIGTPVAVFRVSRRISATKELPAADDSLVGLL